MDWEGLARYGAVRHRIARPLRKPHCAIRRSLQRLLVFRHRHPIDSGARPLPLALEPPFIASMVQPDCEPDLDGCTVIAFSPARLGDGSTRLCPRIWPPSRGILPDQQPPRVGRTWAAYG